jgi:hypothetical protein
MPKSAALSDGKIVARYYRRPQVAKAIDRAGGRYFSLAGAWGTEAIQTPAADTDICQVGGPAMHAFRACTRSGIGNGTVTRGDGCAQPQ